VPYGDVLPRSAHLVLGALAQGRELGAEPRYALNVRTQLSDLRLELRQLVDARRELAVSPFELARRCE